MQFLRLSRLFKPWTSPEKLQKEKSIKMHTRAMILRVRPASSQGAVAWACSFKLMAASGCLGSRQHGNRLFSSTVTTFSAVKSSSSKVFRDADAAVADVKSGSTILSAGFGMCGVAGIAVSSLGCIAMLTDE
jgi:hypothetical protein